MDIVYTVKQSDTNEELLYSLRSIANMPHDRVYMIGGCPKFINRDNVTWISTPAQDTKYKSTTMNLQVAVSLNELSEDFIWMNDDFYILQKIQDPVKELNLMQGTIKQIVQSFLDRNRRLTKYMYGAQRTMLYLNSIGFKDPIGYELHTPFIYNKKRVIEMFKLSGIKDVPILHKRSVYGTLYMKNSVKTKDVKVLRASSVEKSELDMQKFLSSSDYTWPKIRPYLSSKFTEKCKYEL